MNSDGKRSTRSQVVEWKQLDGGVAGTIARSGVLVERDHSDQWARKFDASGELISIQAADTGREKLEGLLELRRKQLFGSSHRRTEVVECN